MERRKRWSAAIVRADKRALREKMRAMGLDYREIGAELARRYRLRPRTAWREAYGWSLNEAARRINDHTGDIGLDPGGISSMSASHLCEYEAWPGQAPKQSGRKPDGRRPTPYLLALLAAVYGCAVLELIDVADREHLPPGDLLVLDKYSQARPVPGRRAPTTVPHQRPQPPQPQQPGAPPLPAVGDLGALGELRGAGGGDFTPVLAAVVVPGLSDIAYGRMEMSDFGDAGIEQAVTMAAHEGSDHAEQAEQRDIGEATLEQLRADVVRLSPQTGQPFPQFLEMRRVRQRIHAALDRRLWPRDQTDLYFLLGCLNGLMAIAADTLGYPYAAEELIRAGWAYATVIDHRPLMGRLRATSSDIAYWHGRPRQARDLAASGVNYLPVGPNAALLHL